jgi:cytochrome P450
MTTASLIRPRACSRYSAVTPSSASGGGGRNSHVTRRGSFLPFGMGATKCIGEKFGTAEATLASILARWTLAPETHAAISPAARLVLVPRTLRVRLARRSTSPA